MKQLHHENACNGETTATAATTFEKEVVVDPLYEQLQREAKQVLENEPELSVLLHRTVLAPTVHSLEDAIAQTVCFRLLLQPCASGTSTTTTMNSSNSNNGNTTVLYCPNTLRNVMRDALDSPVLELGHLMRDAVRLDMMAVVQRDPATDTLLEVLLFYKGFAAAVCHRVAYRLHRSGKKFTAAFLQSQASAVFGVDIHPAAQLGAALMLDHGTGIVIGETAVVGDGCTLLHGVTLGGTGKQHGDRHPKVGQHVLLGAGALILGNIRIGDGAKIGAGSVVLRPIPAGATAVGAPAKIIGRATEVKPGSDLDEVLEHVQFFQTPPSHGASLGGANNNNNNAAAANTSSSHHHRSLTTLSTISDQDDDDDDDDIDDDLNDNNNDQDQDKELEEASKVLAQLDPSETFENDNVGDVDVDTNKTANRVASAAAAVAENEPSVPKVAIRREREDSIDILGGSNQDEMENGGVLNAAAATAQRDQQEQAEDMQDDLDTSTGSQRSCCPWRAYARLSQSAPPHTITLCTLRRFLRRYYHGSSYNSCGGGGASAAAAPSACNGDTYMTQLSSSSSSLNNNNNNDCETQAFACLFALDTRNAGYVEVSTFAQHAVPVLMQHVPSITTTTQAQALVQEIIKHVQANAAAAASASTSCAAPSTSAPLATTRFMPSSSQIPSQQQHPEPQRRVVLTATAAAGG